MNIKNKRRTIAVILAAVLAAGVFAGIGDIIFLNKVSYVY